MKERTSIHDWAFNIVSLYADRGTCARRQAGALGLDSNGRIVGMGMNGVPRGFPHCRFGSPCPGVGELPGETRLCMAVHAEINMIINSSDPAKITEVYVSCSPCHACALALANLPELKRVFYREEYSDRGGILILRRRGVETILWGQ